MIPGSGFNARRGPSMNEKMCEQIQRCMSDEAGR